MAQMTDVLSKLLERTNQGKVMWKATAKEQTFIAVIGNSSVMISREDGAPVLKILDRSGRELAELDSIDARESRENLWALHREARHIALGVDRQLDELLKELEVEA